MMNYITSIYIPFVESTITADYIMDVFYNNDIATVSRVTLIPDVYPSKYSGETYTQAFIDIHEWHDTEAALHFIHSLNDSTKETRFTHYKDNWWPVEINQKPWITTMDLFQEDTTVNWLLFTNIYPLLNTVLQRATNDLGARLMAKLKEIQQNLEWDDIQLSLYEEKRYQQLEDDLCL
jgi:hypothetical protein